MIFSHSAGPGPRLPAKVLIMKFTADGAALLMLLTLACGVAALPTPAFGQSPCRETSARAEEVRSWLLHVVTDNPQPRLPIESGGYDPSAERLAYRLPRADSSDIYFVLDPLICAQAARADAERFGRDTTNPPAVHVLRLGPTHYLVFAFRMRAGRFEYAAFDDEFRPVPGP
jgi:hypothetical protein